MHRRIGTRLRSLAAACSLVWGLVGMVPPANAVPTTYYVNPSGSAGANANCADPYGTALAAAVTAAASGDTIHLCAGTYTDQSISFAKDLTFEGDGQATTVIDGLAASDGVGGFLLSPILDGGTSLVTIRDLTMTAGFPALIAGTVVVERASFVDNEYPVAPRLGGAIKASGSVTVADATFSGNDARQGGGAIYTPTTVTITNSTFTANTAVNGSGIGGGAVYGNTGVTVSGSSFSSNDTGNSGGAIRAGSSTASIVVTRSFFYGNSAGQYGGAIAGFGTNATVTATNSTFDFNRDSGGTCACSGAAIYGKTVTVTHVTASANRHNYVAGSASNNSRGGTLVAIGALTLTNTLVVETDVNLGACAATSLVNGGGNVVTAASCSAFGTPVTAASVALGAIADNGGETQTRAIALGSTAVDASPCLGSVTIDQRGQARPYGSACDAGAFEAQLWTTTSGQVSPTGDVRLGYAMADVATVRGYAPSGAGFADPTGTVEFSYCFSAATPPTWPCSTTTIAAGVALTGGANTADGVATASLGAWTPAAKGYYLLHAVYTRSGGAAYLSSADDGTNQAFRVIDAVGTTSATVATSPIAIGGSTTATATVSGVGGVRPTGTVTFSTCYAPSSDPVWATCSSGATLLGTVTLSAGGGADEATAVSPSLAPDHVGRYLIHAAYSGDARYTGSSADVVLVAETGPTSVTYTGSIGYATDPASVTLEATVGGPCRSDRTITFSADADGNGTPEDYIVTSDANGVATRALGSLGGPTLAVAVSVAASADCASASTSATISFDREDSTTDGSVAASLAFGSNTTESVSVTGGSGRPTGSVTFSVCFSASGTPSWPCTATPLGSVTLSPGGANEGVATSPTFVPDAVGTYLIRAVYSGDASYRSSSDVDLVSVTAGPTTITYTGSLAYETDPADVTLAAAVSGACGAGRAVTFLHDDDADGTYDVPVGSATTDATGSASTTWLAAGGGTAEVRAVVAASANCEDDQVEATIAFTRAATTTAADLLTSSLALGATTTAGVAVTGTSPNPPTGSVTFSVCYSATATPPVWATCSGTADTLDTVALTADGSAIGVATSPGLVPTKTGTYLIHAAYAGDARYASSSDDDVLTVTTGATTVEFTGLTAYASTPATVALEATVGGPCPAGRNVEFLWDSAGNGTYATSVGDGVSDGSGAVQATWSGVVETADIRVAVAASTDCGAGSTDVTIALGPASSTTDVTVGTSPLQLGSTTSVTTTVTGAAPTDPTGAVVLSWCSAVGSTPVWGSCSATELATVTLGAGTADDGIGVAVTSFTPAHVGTYLIHAAYGGDAAYDASSYDVLLTVTTGPTTIVYSGALYYPTSPATVTLQATVGGPCAVGRAVSFLRDADGDGTYETSIGSGTTNGSGVASATWGSVSGPLADVEATVVASADCASAITTATIVVAGTGDASNGGGWYSVGSAGRVNLGYTLQKKVSRTGTTTVSGQLLWHVQGKVRLKGTITGFTILSSCPVSGARCAVVVGTGTLSIWDSGAGSWVASATGVPFTVTVADGGTTTTCVKRTCSTTSKPDAFGMDIPGRTVDGESGLIQLRGGSIVVK